jgi:hypothetical protein
MYTRIEPSLMLVVVIYKFYALMALIREEDLKYLENETFTPLWFV